MADKQTQALKRLTKKLNALRKTLRTDERNLLDRMILGDEAAAEVAAHRVKPKASNKAAEVAAHRSTPKAADKAAEVAAHRFFPKAAGASRPMIAFDAISGNYVIAEDEPEVEGHLLKEAINPKIATKVAPKAAT